MTLTGMNARAAQIDARRWRRRAWSRARRRRRRPPTRCRSCAPTAGTPITTRCTTPTTAWATHPIIAMMYTNAFGRFSVTDNLCGMSVAQVRRARAIVVPVTRALKGAASPSATARSTACRPPWSTTTRSAARSRGSSPSRPRTGIADFGSRRRTMPASAGHRRQSGHRRALTAASTPTNAQSEAVRAGIARCCSTATCAASQR